MSIIQFQEYLRESNINRLLQHISNRSFGILSVGPDEQTQQRVRMAIKKAGWDYMTIEGQMVRPSESEGEGPTTTPDVCFLIIVKKNQDIPTFMKWLFMWADQLSAPSYLLRDMAQKHMRVIGVAEGAWPGRKIQKSFTEFAPEKFISVIKRWKGENYEFGTLTQ